MLLLLKAPRSSPSVAERCAGAPVRWLLLRGLGRERRHWFDFPEALAAGLGVEHHAVDLPGMGALSCERVPGSIPEVALAVRRRLEERAAGGPWGVLGISLGGMVAVSLASAWPSGVSHVVVINASSRCSFLHQRLRPAGFARLAYAALARSAGDRERRIYALTTNASERQIALWAARAAALGVDPPSRAALARQLLAAGLFRAPPVTQPALVLSGGKDRLVSAVCSSALARELGAAYRRHPTAGHDLPLEDPGWVIEEMRAWLASTASR